MFANIWCQDLRPIENVSNAATLPFLRSIFHKALKSRQSAPHLSTIALEALARIFTSKIVGCDRLVLDLRVVWLQKCTMTRKSCLFFNRKTVKVKLFPWLSYARAARSSWNRSWRTDSVSYHFWLWTFQVISIFSRDCIIMCVQLQFIGEFIIDGDYVLVVDKNELFFFFCRSAGP